MKQYIEHCHILRMQLLVYYTIGSVFAQTVHAVLVAQMVAEVLYMLGVVSWN